MRTVASVHKMLLLLQVRGETPMGGRDEGWAARAFVLHDWIPVRGRCVCVCVCWAGVQGWVCGGEGGPFCMTGCRRRGGRGT